MFHDNVLDKRQDGDDVDADAATDPLRDAIDYASAFRARATVTYSAVSTGAQPSDAVLVATTTVSPGNAAVGPPPDSREQGPRYVVDHILELQFVVGAFSVNPRPQTSIASAFSGAFNLNGIPSRLNGFKQQVFTGRIKSNPDNPSARTYPQDFGFALQKFLEDNEQDVYGVVDDVGAALSSDTVGNYSAIRPYFTAYAQNEYRSAIDFLSNWIGTSYTPDAPSATSTSAPATTTSASVTKTSTTKAVNAQTTTIDDTAPLSTVNLGKLSIP
ncbi:MAG: hypothetical protein Q9182_005726 [Xanthomendoza sp. 2 TL-2023]